MKDIFGPSLCVPTELMVNLFVFPFLQDFGLPLGQIGLHGKFRFGQIECVAVIHCFPFFFLRIRRRSVSCVFLENFLC